ncbi:hypothetical protein ABT298_06545 [Streptomyces sp. NPDC001034]|uniref:hypothetical protein n=1 Tax=Streptomyces sp. NPDC001034 TaxID=3154375 RepID=UPI0033319EE4
MVVHTPLPTFKTLPDRDVPRLAGSIFPQPTATDADGVEMLLDDATGQGWRILTWNNDPTAFLSGPRRAALDRLGAFLGYRATGRAGTRPVVARCRGGRRSAPGPPGRAPTASRRTGSPPARGPVCRCPRSPWAADLPPR